MPILQDLARAAKSRIKEEHIPLYLTEYVPESKSVGMIKIGKNVLGKDMFWIPNSSWANTNVMIVGGSGSGKTQFVKQLLYSMHNVGKHFMVYDYHHDYSFPFDKTNPGKTDDFVDRCEVQVYDVDKDGLPINPLEMSRRINKGPLDNAYAISETLRMVFNIGAQQVALLRRAIMLAYEENSISQEDQKTWENKPPEFNKIRDSLDNLLLQAKDLNIDKESIIRLKSRIEMVFDYDLFKQDTKFKFEDLFEQNTAIKLTNLNFDELKNLSAQLMTKSLMYALYERGPSRFFYMCMVDEAHKIHCKTDKSGKIPTSELMREGRKYGCSTGLSSQLAQDFTRDTFENTYTKIVLRCEHSNAVKLVDYLKVDSGPKKNLEKQDLVLAMSRMPIHHGLYKEGNKLLKIRTIPYYKNMK